MPNDIFDRLYDFFWIISIGRMLLLAPNLDNAGPLFALVITPDFYLRHVEVVY